MSRGPGGAARRWHSGCGYRLFRIWTCTLIELNGTRQTYLRAAGSLGWAFPAALGAKCAAPNRKVVCFTGDGGFYYHMAELETARRRGIAVVVVVNNNSGFGQDYVNMSRQGKDPQRMRDLACFGPTDRFRAHRAIVWPLRDPRRISSGPDAGS